jgi:hypothetical protein
LIAKQNCGEIEIELDVDRFKWWTAFPAKTSIHGSGKLENHPEIMAFPQVAPGIAWQRCFWQRRGVW